MTQARTPNGVRGILPKERGRTHSCRVRPLLLAIPRALRCARADSGRAPVRDGKLYSKWHTLFKMANYITNRHFHARQTVVGTTRQ